MQQFLEMPQSLWRHLVKHEGSGLGMMEYSRVVAASKEKNYLKKRVQSTEEKPFETGKDAGATNAAKQFKKTHPHLTFGESTA